VPPWHAGSTQTPLLPSFLSEPWSVNNYATSSVSTCAHVALWDPHSDYLRHLLGHLPAAASGRPLDSPRVAVPVRLHERLARRLPALDDEPEPALRDALAWEVAALLSGETICEWAYRSALAA
jgi:hypothetical protein